jgi:hypothetical protein
MGLIGKTYRFWKNKQSVNFRDELQPPGNMADVRFAEIAIVQKFNNFAVKRIVLNKFPLNGEDVISQQTSLHNRYDSYAKIFVDIYRNIHKCLVPAAQFKYNRFKNVADVVVKFDFDKRQYLNIVRKFKKQFDDLGIEKSSDRREKYFNLYYYYSGQYNYYNFPDPQGVLSQKVCAELKKYIYVLVLKFKNSSGDVLQETTFELPGRKIAYYSVNIGRLEVNFMKQSMHMSRTISFDIPEDIKNVSTVECFIEERVANVPAQNLGH